MSVGFGLFLPQVRLGYPALLERALLAEQQGFETVWFMDHLWAAGAPELDSYEGWTIATAIAARTERIRVGHMVLCDAFRHPSLLAKMATTLDHISNGRLDLGIGWGSLPNELHAFGFGDLSNRERSERLRETLEIVRRLLTGERVSHLGRFFELDGAQCNPTPVQSPIPVHIGGSGVRFTLPLVREYAQWWNCPSYAVDRLADMLPLVGDVRVSTQHPVAVVTSEAERPEIETVARRRFGGWGGLICGSAAEIAAALQREADMGVERFVIQLWDFATPSSIELFARDVIPRLR